MSDRPARDGAADRVDMPGGGLPGQLLLRAVAQVAEQASAASVPTPDPTDRVAPGSLTPGAAPTSVRRGRRRSYPRHHLARDRSGPRLPIALVLVLMGLIVAGLGYQHATGVSLLPSALRPEIRTPQRTFPVLDPSPPVSIAIQSVRLQAPVSDTGLAPDGTIAPPPADRYNEAGWYDQSPTPGQYGPAVIVGHVDTRTGPAVFH